MSPPRVLPPGHFIGDGHNHGAESENHVHQHGHDHAHESPEQHLHHMQEHQEARGRATLEEFHQAARETAQLTSGQRPESSQASQPRGEPKAPARENAAPRGQASESRPTSSNPENQGSNAGNSRPATRDFSGLARLFSAAAFAAPSSNHSAWAEANRQQLRQSNSGSEPTRFQRGSDPEATASHSSRPESGETGTLKSAQQENTPESQVFSQALAKLRVALQDTALREPGAAKLPPEAAEALAVLLQDVIGSPELLANLPPNLKSMVLSLMASLGTLTPNIFSKLTAANLGEALRALFGRAIPGNFGLATANADAPARGLGLFLGLPLFQNPAVAKLSPGLLQRFEKALLQFLRLFGTKPQAKSDKEAPALDKALLEQLAALVAAEDKRRKEKERLRKKEKTPLALRSKADSELTEEDSPEPERFEEPLMNACN